MGSEMCIRDRFRNAFSQGANALNSSSAGGGFLGAIASGIGTIFGGGNPLAGSIDTANSNVASMAAALSTPRPLAGFANGTNGWMKPVGGMSGVDRNVVAFRMSSNEEFAVRRKGEVGGPVGGGNVYHISGNVLTPEMWAQIQMMDNVSSAQAVGTTERRASRRARRRMGK